MFARVVSAAAIAGLLSGLLLTALQQIEIAPLLRDAEVREAAARVGDASSAPHADAEVHWAPADGIQRLAATAVANVVLGIGFALLLGAAMSLHRHAGWRAGLLWGLSGFAVLYVAPSLGLPPELPGAAAAPLPARTIWWTATVAASAAGLWIAVFAKSWALRCAGIALIFVPHLVGAPMPAADATLVSAEAGHRFIRATAIVNAAFWIALGVLIGSAQQRALAPGQQRNRPASSLN